MEMLSSMLENLVAATNETFAPQTQDSVRCHLAAMPSGIRMPEAPCLGV